MIVDTIDFGRMLDDAKEAFNSLRREKHALEASLHEVQRRWDEEKVKHRAALDNVEVAKSDAEDAHAAHNALCAEKVGWEITFDNQNRTITAQAKEVARMAQELHDLKVSYGNMAEAYTNLSDENQKFRETDVHKLRKERDLYRCALGWAHKEAHKLVDMIDRDKNEIEGG
jgi:chromosome segregation ATPase